MKTNYVSFLKLHAYEPIEDFKGFIKYVESVYISAVLYSVTIDNFSRKPIKERLE